MLNKLLSGRFIFTIVTSIVFAFLAITSKLSADKVMEVILIVIYAYFNRGDRVQQNGGQK